MTVLDTVVDSQDNNKHISVLAWHFAYAATARNMSCLLYIFSTCLRVQNQNKRTVELTVSHRLIIIINT